MDSCRKLSGKLTASNPKVLDSKPTVNELDLSKTLWDKTDFIEAVKANRKTQEPIEVGHRTISISQIGLIAAQVGGGEVEMESWKRAFEGNNYANALLAAPLARKQWVM